MTGVLRILAAACLSLSLTAAAAAAAPLARTCMGKAGADFAAQVEVRFSVDETGAITAREAIWRPFTSATEEQRVFGATPNLEIVYDAPTEQGLGTAARLDTHSILLTADEHLFDGARMTFDVPGGKAWAVPVEATVVSEGGKVIMMFGAAEFGATGHADLFAALEQLGPARLAVVTNRGAQAATYDLSRRTERDKLFAQAWKGATRSARNPRNCKKAED